MEGKGVVLHILIMEIERVADWGGGRNIVHATAVKQMAIENGKFFRLAMGRKRGE